MSDHDVIGILFQHFPGRTEKTQRILTNPSKFRIRHVPNKNHRRLPVQTHNCTQNTETEQQAAAADTAIANYWPARPYKQRRKTMTVIETDLQVKSE